MEWQESTLNKEHVTFQQAVHFIETADTAVAIYHSFQSVSTERAALQVATALLRDSLD